MAGIMMPYLGYGGNVMMQNILAGCKCESYFVRSPSDTGSGDVISGEWAIGLLGPSYGTSIQPGRFGNSIGTASSTDIEMTAALNRTITSQQRCFEAWVKSDPTYSAEGAKLQFFTPGAGDAGWQATAQLYMAAAGSWGNAYTWDDALGYMVEQQFAVPNFTGGWHLYSFGWNGTAWQVYLDGQLLWSKNNPTPGPWGSYSVLVSEFYGGSGFAQMDNLVIYGVGRTGNYDPNVDALAWY